MRAAAVLFMVGCAASPTATSDAPLTCDVGGTAMLGNACVKSSQPSARPTQPLATPTASLGGVAANQEAYGLRLVSVNGHYEGAVSFTPQETGTFEIYLSANPSFRVVDAASGNAITPSCTSSITSTECSSLRHVGTYSFARGQQVRLEIGPTTASYIRLDIQTRETTPPVCTAGELTDETNACEATTAGDTPITARSFTNYNDTLLAPSTVYGVTLPAVSGGYAGHVDFNVNGEVELYLGTPNIPLRIFSLDNTTMAVEQCSRYIPSTECAKLRRGTRLTGGHYRLEFGPSASSYVRVEVRAVTTIGTVKLASGQTYATDNSADNVSAGDLDGDGVLDLAVSCPDDASGETFVDVMKGDGTGAFALQTSVRTGDPARTAIADFDRDGVNDIAGTDWDGMGPMGAFLLHNAGGFTFTKTAWGNFTDYLPMLSIGDFDEDGTLELVVPWTDSQNTSSGLGGFHIVKPASNTIVQAETGFGAETADAVAGDFNGDGHQDVVTASASTGAARLYLGNGSGTVTLSSTFTLPAGGVTRLYAFDLDRDGKSDLVAVAQSGTTVSYGTSVGLAAAAQTLPTRQRAVAAGDFDHDGRLDLVTGDYLDQTLTFYVATDAGFEPAGTRTAANGGHSLVAVDVDRDGFTDLVVPVSDGVEVFRGTP